MRLSLLHDCEIDGQRVRHRTTIDCREVKLNSGDVRLEGVRCDGRPVEAYGRWSGSTLTTEGEFLPTERLMYEPATGREWISINYGPWQPLVELPEQPDLFSEEASA